MSESWVELSVGIPLVWLVIWVLTLFQLCLEITASLMVGGHLTRNQRYTARSVMSLQYC